MRRALLPSLAALALLGGAAAAAPAGAATITLVQGEQLVPATRPGTGLESAMAALLRGPTAAERRRQVRTYLVPGTTIRSMEVRGGVATIDFSTRLVRGEDSGETLARLAQVVGTATAVPGVRAVRVRVLGGTPLGLFPGVDARRPLTPRMLETPDVRPPVSDEAPDGAATDETRALQQRLADLGYLDPAGVDGTPGPRTTAAVIAFQKWQGLGRDGVVGQQTAAALAGARRPAPLGRGPGKRLEILLDRQVVLAIDGNRVVRVLHASTGAPATPTTVGTFQVYGKFARWWSVPFRTWLPWSVAFVGGIALHEYPEVPVTPASHGCVRLVAGDARWVYDFMAVGGQVRVMAVSR